MGRPKKNTTETGTAVATTSGSAPAPAKKAAKGPAAQANLFSILQIAMAKPDFNPEVAERLIAMQERAEARDAEKAFNAAFRKVSAELPTIKKNGAVHESQAKGGKLMYRHSLFEDIHKVVMPVLLRHGFTLHFETESTPVSATAVTVLTHDAGHARRTSYTVGRDDGPGRNAAQSIMSAMKYCKRHGIVSLLNLNEEGADDDGATAAAQTDERRAKRADDKLGKVAETTAKKPAEKPAETKGATEHKEFPPDAGKTETLKAPSAADEPDDYYKFLEKHVAKVESKRDLSNFWNEHVEPVLAEIFETDLPKIKGLFNARREALGGKKA